MAAQKYNFTNYGVQQGLAQSQPQDICQDVYGNLWAGTLGGLSRYDGWSFHNYNTSSGLNSHLIYKSFASADGTLLIGTENGLQSINGKNITAYTTPGAGQEKVIIDIAANTQGKVFVLNVFGTLMEVFNKNLRIAEPAGHGFITTALSVNDEGEILAAVYRKGIYKLTNNQWQLLIPLSETGVNFGVKKIITKGGSAWLLAKDAVYKYADNKLEKLISNQNIKQTFLSFEKDNLENIWIGTTRGAYIISKDAVPEYVDAASGFTDNSVNAIFKDREGNLWFAADGDGLYKLSNESFYIISKNAGLKGNVVMGIIEDKKGNTWVGTSDGGLLMYDGTNFHPYKIPSEKPETQKVNALLCSSSNDIWIGTLGSGVWRIANGKCAPILNTDGTSLGGISGIYEDSNHTIWATSPQGLYYYENGNFKKIKGISNTLFSIVELSPGVILTGGTSGLIKITDKSVPEKVTLSGTTINTVSCFARWKDYILIGTGNDGIVFWRPKDNRILHCNETTGLASDFIFSFYTDSAGVIYAGTGHGISRIIADEKTKTFHIQNYSLSGSVYGPECNLNVVCRRQDGDLWFGTTKGIAVLKPGQPAQPKIAPLIYLKSVNLFSNPVPSKYATDSVVAWNNLPYHLSLPYNQNHLTFNFTGICLANPESIRYQYKLEGVDTAYSAATTIPSVVYSNLGPGNYRFKVKAITANGISSSNEAEYLFQIQTPFFRQTWFIVLMVFLLIASGILIQYLRTKIKQKREAVLAAVRLEEQQKIQERTAEDLHDDFGNKITRITVLADVLNNKMDKANTEQRKLVEQIKDNAQALYLGTKDIIWSLTPGNDNLYDLLERCHLFGTNLFEDTSIEFKMTGNIEEYRNIKIPVTISRNLVMIIKEALNNTLKHSGAGASVISVSKTANDIFNVTIADNGKGFDQHATTKGNGLINIQKRVNRLQGEYKAFNNPTSGFVISVSFKIPPNEG